MTHDELIKILGSLSPKLRIRVSTKIGTILAVAESLRSQEKSFTFAGNPDIDNRVKTILIELSDEILDEAEHYAIDAVDEEDQELALAYVHSTKDSINKIDKYSSHLYYILEGWIAIGFANRISKGRLATYILTYMSNPYVSDLWKEAFRIGNEYASGIIREGGYKWGKGTPIDVIKGYALVEAGIINSAYNYGVLQGYGRMRAIGYRVHRGSPYDCPTCDELCIGVHPLTEIVLPAHPNCVCYTTPVFAE